MSAVATKRSVPPLLGVPAAGLAAAAADTARPEAAGDDAGTVAADAGAAAGLPASGVLPHAAKNVTPAPPASSFRAPRREINLALLVSAMCISPPSTW